MWNIEDINKEGNQKKLQYKLVHEFKDVNDRSSVLSLESILPFPSVISVQISGLCRIWTPNMNVVSGIDNRELDNTLIEGDSFGVVLSSALISLLPQPSLTEKQQQQNSIHSSSSSSSSITYMFAVASFHRIRTVRMIGVQNILKLAESEIEGNECEDIGLQQSGNENSQSKSNQISIYKYIPCVQWKPRHNSDFEYILSVSVGKRVTFVDEMLKQLPPTICKSGFNLENVAFTHKWIDYSTLAIIDLKNFLTLYQFPSCTSINQIELPQIRQLTHSPFDSLIWKDRNEIEQNKEQDQINIKKEYLSEQALNYIKQIEFIQWQPYVSVSPIEKEDSQLYSYLDKQNSSSIVSNSDSSELIHLPFLSFISQEGLLQKVGIQNWKERLNEIAEKNNLIEFMNLSQDYYDGRGILPPTLSLILRDEREKKIKQFVFESDKGLLIKLVENQIQITSQLLPSSESNITSNDLNMKQSEEIVNQKDSRNDIDIYSFIDLTHSLINFALNIGSIDEYLNFIHSILLDRINQDKKIRKDIQMELGMEIVHGRVKIIPIKVLNELVNVLISENEFVLVETVLLMLIKNVSKRYSDLREYNSKENNSENENKNKKQDSEEFKLQMEDIFQFSLDCALENGFVRTILALPSIEWGGFCFQQIMKNQSKQNQDQKESKIEIQQMCDKIKGGLITIPIQGFRFERIKDLEFDKNEFGFIEHEDEVDDILLEKERVRNIESENIVISREIPMSNIIRERNIEYVLFSPDHLVNGLKLIWLKQDRRKRKEEDEQKQEDNELNNKFNKPSSEEIILSVLYITLGLNFPYPHTNTQLFNLKDKRQAFKPLIDWIFEQSNSLLQSLLNWDYQMTLESVIKPSLLIAAEFERENDNPSSDRISEYNKSDQTEQNYNNSSDEMERSRLLQTTPLSTYSSQIFHSPQSIQITPHSQTQSLHSIDSNSTPFKISLQNQLSNSPNQSPIILSQQLNQQQQQQVPLPPQPIYQVIPQTNMNKQNLKQRPVILAPPQMSKIVGNKNTLTQTSSLSTSSSQPPTTLQQPMNNTTAEQQVKEKDELNRKSLLIQKFQDTNVILIKQIHDLVEFQSQTLPSTSLFFIKQLQSSNNMPQYQYQPQSLQFTFNSLQQGNQQNKQGQFRIMIESVQQSAFEDYLEIDIPLPNLDLNEDNQKQSNNQGSKNTVQQINSIISEILIKKQYQRDQKKKRELKKKEIEEQEKKILQRHYYDVDLPREWFVKQIKDQTKTQQLTTDMKLTQQQDTQQQQFQEPSPHSHISTTPHYHQTQISPNSPSVQSPMKIQQGKDNKIGNGNNEKQQDGEDDDDELNEKEEKDDNLGFVSVKQIILKILNEAQMIKGLWNVLFDILMKEDKDKYKDMRQNINIISQQQQVHLIHYIIPFIISFNIHLPPKAFIQFILYFIEYTSQQSIVPLLKKQQCKQIIMQLLSSSIPKLISLIDEQKQRKQNDENSFSQFFIQSSSYEGSFQYLIDYIIKNDKDKQKESKDQNLIKDIKHNNNRLFISRSILSALGIVCLKSSGTFQEIGIKIGEIISDFELVINGFLEYGGIRGSLEQGRKRMMKHLSERNRNEKQEIGQERIRERRNNKSEFRGDVDTNLSLCLFGCNNCYKEEDIGKNNEKEILKENKISRVLQDDFEYYLMIDSDDDEHLQEFQTIFDFLFRYISSFGEGIEQIVEMKGNEERIIIEMEQQINLLEDAIKKKLKQLSQLSVSKTALLILSIIDQSGMIIVDSERRIKRRKRIIIRREKKPNVDKNEQQDIPSPLFTNTNESEFEIFSQSEEESSILNINRCKQMQQQLFQLLYQSDVKQKEKWKERILAHCLVLLITDVSWKVKILLETKKYEDSNDEGEEYKDQDEDKQERIIILWDNGRHHSLFENLTQSPSQIFSQSLIQTNKNIGDYFELSEKSLEIVFEYLIKVGERGISNKTVNEKEQNKLINDDAFLFSLLQQHQIHTQLNSPLRYLGIGQKHFGDLTSFLFCDVVGDIDGAKKSLISALERWMKETSDLILDLSKYIEMNSQTHLIPFDSLPQSVKDQINQQQNNNQSKLNEEEEDWFGIRNRAEVMWKYLINISPGIRYEEIGNKEEEIQDLFSLLSEWMIDNNYKVKKQDNNNYKQQQINKFLSEVSITRRVYYAALRILEGIKLWDQSSGQIISESGQSIVSGFPFNQSLQIGSRGYQLQKRFELSLIPTCLIREFDVLYLLEEYLIVIGEQFSSLQSFRSGSLFNLRSQTQLEKLGGFQYGQIQNRDQIIQIKFNQLNSGLTEKGNEIGKNQSIEIGSPYKSDTKGSNIEIEWAKLIVQIASSHNISNTESELGQEIMKELEKKIIVNIFERIVMLKVSGSEDKEKNIEISNGKTGVSLSQLFIRVVEEGKGKQGDINLVLTTMLDLLQEDGEFLKSAHGVGENANAEFVDRLLWEGRRGRLFEFGNRRMKMNGNQNQRCCVCGIKIERIQNKVNINDLDVNNESGRIILYGCGHIAHEQCVCNNKGQKKMWREQECKLCNEINRSRDIGIAQKFENNDDDELPIIEPWEAPQAGIQQEGRSGRLVVEDAKTVQLRISIFR